ncbi:MAG: hypothetical protein KJ957_07945 [Candidatus Omnitrophica bacterium]|nr:hypothetical protein [Candidatus Omnitrophota bacterium]
MNTEHICEQIQKILFKLPFHYEPEEVPFRNGLYFFYEEGESSKHSPQGRVVRIGNHPRSQNRLIGRLQDHYYGGKNGSVFRRLLGGALIRKDNPKDACLKHWEEQNSPICRKCKPIEAEVNRILENKFRFKCINIENKEFRNLMEKNIIATISLCSLCNKPTKKWLGNYACSENVRASGLWNSDYVNNKDYIIAKTDLLKLKRLTIFTINRFYLKKR